MDITVSVVIPCFNGDRYIRETLQSVIAQTVAVSEILVIDDGSTDRSAEVVTSVGSKLIRLIQQSNSGESVARNRGIDEARGEWIAFLDADDLWHPRKIELQLASLLDAQDLNPVCAHTGFYNFGEWTNAPEPRPYEGCRQLELAELLMFPVNTSSALVRADLAVRFPEWTKAGEDSLFFAELSLEGPFCYQPEPLTGYRRRSGQQTSNVSHLTSAHASLMKWLELHPEIGEEKKKTVLAQVRAMLLRCLEVLKWQRNWTKYWNLRNYLCSIEGIDTTPSPLLNERIFSPVLYRVKDWIDARRAV